MQTLLITKERFFWLKCRDTIREYVNNCDRCKRNAFSLTRPIEPLKPLPVIARPWYRVGMDLTGPLIHFTMVDHFTRWVEEMQYNFITTSPSVSVALRRNTIWTNKHTNTHIIIEFECSFEFYMSELLSLTIF